MTMVEDRPAVHETTGGTPDRSARPATSASSWRFSARLARREVRRRPGRTVLVLLLVAIPVFGMTLASIGARTNALTETESFQRDFGTADLVVSANNQYLLDEDGNAVSNADRFGLGRVPAIPDGSSRLDYIETYSAVQTDLPDGTQTSRYVQFTSIDPSNAMTDGMFVIDEGTAPSSSDETMLSPGIAEAFDVTVGDTLRLSVPDLDLTVTAIGRTTRWLNNDLVVVPDFDQAIVRPDRRWETTMLDLPANVSDVDLSQMVQSFRGADFEAQSAVDRGFEIGTVKGEQLAWGWVAGVVAFIAVGIVIASAFATSARRQLATVGQLSANGASERLIRRTLGLQGMWTASLGAVVGVGLGIGAAMIGQQYGITDQLAGYRASSLQIQPLDIVVVVLTALAAGTIAALVPARSASRIPVLSALAGRRPVAVPPRWLVPVGIGLFGFGLFLLAAVASSQDGGNFSAAMAVLGALGILFGIVCASPLIVAWIGSVGSRRGGVVRIASRSLGRSRMRSAGVLTAVATVAAIAIVGLTVAGSARSLDESQQEFGSSSSNLNLNYSVYNEYPTDEFGNVSKDFDPPPQVAQPVPEGLRRTIEAILPDATWRPITQVTWDPPSDRVYDTAQFPITTPTVADDEVLALLSLDADQRATLAEQGTLSLAPYVDGMLSINTLDGLIDVDFGEAPLEYESSSEFGADALITPAKVAELGLDTQVNWVIVDNPVDLTKTQRAALNDARPVDLDSAFVSADSNSLGEPASASAWYYYTQEPGFDVPWPLIQAAVLGASLLMVLLVVAIGLSLAATESRDERDVLHVVGAPPRTLRRVAAAKAWVLTTGAAVIAVPAGYIVVRVITWVAGESAPFPVLGALGMLVLIPAIAWAATLLVSAIAQKARPIQVSTITLD